MAELRKYAFDLDFTVGAKNREPEAAPMEMGEQGDSMSVEVDVPPEPPPMFSEEELSMARDMAFEDGRRHGFMEGAEAAGIHATSAIDAMSKGLDFLSAQQAEANAQIQKDAVRLTMAILRRMLPATAAKYAFDEVTHMVEEVVSHVLDEPRIIVRVVESLVESVRERMTEVALSHGFEGRVVVQADARVELGDVRVEWTNGGAERDMGRLMAEVEAIVERGVTAPPPEPVDAVRDDVEEAPAEEAINQDEPAIEPAS